MERLGVGRILGTRGRRGELRVRPAARDPRRFEGLERVYVEGVDNPEGGFRVRRVWYHREEPILSLEGIDDIPKAKKLQGCELQVPAEEAVNLGEGEYFIHDLLGLDVLSESGRRLGRLEEVLEGPGNDVYVVRAAGAEWLVPAVAAVVREVDLVGGTMRIHELPGLLEPDEPV